MSSVSAIGTTPATTAPANDIFGGLGADAFMQLLVAQLRYQNPLSPSDPTAMMGQIASYAQVEALQKLQAGQAVDATLSEARLATDMVGSFVEAADATGAEIAGTVVAARFTPAGPVLVLDNGGELTLSAVTRIERPVPSITPEA